MRKIKRQIRETLKTINRLFFYNAFQKELFKLKGSAKKGEIKLLGKSFAYHHGQAFLDTYQELFVQNIYKFNTQNTEPLIIDCGANMGLSLLYFSKEFPNSKIIAFEPDDSVLSELRQNVLSHDLKNVTLFEKAVWSSETTLPFFTDQGMGGRVETSYVGQEPKTIQTLRLKNFLNQKVDFLKMDIEGAEIEVLKDCQENLKNVDRIFVEYHSFENREQELGELLDLLKQNGFRYHLRQSFSRPRPFVDRSLVCEYYDMAINVFAYRS